MRLFLVFLIDGNNRTLRLCSRKSVELHPDSKQFYQASFSTSKPQ